MKTKCIRLVAAILLAFLVNGLAQPASDARPPKISDDGLWEAADHPPRDRGPRQPWLLVPERFKTFKLNHDGLRNSLARAPKEFTAAARRSEAVLSLPMPDGTFARFRVVESPIMEPGLAAKFPAFKTYCGQGVDDPTASVRLGTSPAGFHALVISTKGSVFVDLVTATDPDLHASIRREDLPTASRFFGFSTPPGDPVLAAAQPMIAAAAVNPTVTLRTYRLAVAAQGEYTQFHGGTVAGAMAAIVTTVNRVNSFYERELAIRFVLVANNDRLIYLDPLIDPYPTNNNDVILLDQNQANLNAVIGSANYDVGHEVRGKEPWDQFTQAMPKAQLQPCRWPRAW